MFERQPVAQTPTRCHGCYVPQPPLGARSTAGRRESQHSFGSMASASQQCAAELQRVRLQEDEVFQSRLDQDKPASVNAKGTK
jgi:hypothetical protein